MRRLLIYTLLLAATLVGLNSCMQHNGYIGDWFGTWKLRAIELDGTPVEDYRGDIFFQFQTEIVRTVKVAPHQGYSERFGSWKDEGSTLILDFSYTADVSTIHTPLPETYLEKAKNLLQITERNSREMTWVLERSDGVVVTYILKKQ